MELLIARFKVDLEFEYDLVTRGNTLEEVLENTKYIRHPTNGGNPIITDVIDARAIDAVIERWIQPRLRVVAPQNKACMAPTAAPTGPKK